MKQIIISYISQSHLKFKQVRVVVNGALWHKIKKYTKYWFKEPLTPHSLGFYYFLNNIFKLILCVRSAPNITALLNSYITT